MGEVDVHRARVPARARPAALGRRDAAARRGARLAGRPRPDPHRARRAAHPHRRARVDPGRHRRGPARRGQRLPRRRRGHRALPRRAPRRAGADAPRRAATPRPRAPSAPRRRPAHPRARAPDPQGRGPAHAAHLRASPRRPASSGPHLRLLRLVAEVHREQTGRDAADQRRRRGGAALADLGFPAELLRGLALLARTAGLLGHLAEELRAADRACGSTARSTSARPTTRRRTRPNRTLRKLSGNADVPLRSEELGPAC